MRWHRNCNAMDDTVKITTWVSSASVPNEILCLLIMHIIPRGQIYVDINNRILVFFISCRTTSSSLWIDVSTAAVVAHTDNFQSEGRQCLSH